ncbi:MAG: M13 family metallopeptidase [Lachnospiraceae bacterium]|nr:M13 family metallopeptidase [Lachnospiraceae bacterium]
MKKSLNKFTAVLLLLMITFLSGCSELEDTVSGDEPGDKWVDSDIIGSVTRESEIRIQDDYAAAANKDWILSAEEGRETSAIDMIDEVILSNKRALLEDSSLNSKEALELKKYAELAEDWDARALAGTDPLKPYIGSIQSISTAEELCSWMTDPEANPLGEALITVNSAYRSEENPDAYAVYLFAPQLSLETASSGYNYYFAINTSGLRYKEYIEYSIEYMLSGLGYDQHEIKAVTSGCYRIEKKLLENMSCRSVDSLYLNEADNTLTRSDIAEAAGAYPIEKYLDKWGYKGRDSYIADLKYIQGLQDLDLSGELEDIKSMFIVHYLLFSEKYLDRDSYDFAAYRSYASEPEYRTDEEEDGSDEEGTQEGENLNDTEESELDSILFNEYIAQSPMVAAMDKLYVEKYTDAGEYDRLYGMTEEIIEEFKDIFSKEDWLSEEGRVACLDKLETMSIHVIYPSTELVDYSSLDITAKKEGGTFLDAALDCSRYYNFLRAERALKPFDRQVWDPYDQELSTTICNAMYDPQTNGIYIFSGIANDPEFYPEMSEEQLLAGIGTTVGHEITHGFDDGGALFNKEGVEEDWLPEDDKLKFVDRMDKVSAYYSTLHPYEASGACEGSLVCGEATADMGGIKCVLEIAENDEDFDYDAFFRHYALCWATQYELETESGQFNVDSHPLNFYRINVALQQFDEFLETYDIKPGDGMYLEKERRIQVW